MTTHCILHIDERGGGAPGVFPENWYDNITNWKHSFKDS